MLKQALASPSNSRIMQLHDSFQDLRQGDDLFTRFIQNAKALFDELAAASWSVSLKDFNLYVFYGLQVKFKDLVTSLVTKAESFSYTDLHSHLLTYEFLHKTSLQSMKSATINALLLPTTPSALVAQRQPFGNFSRNIVDFMEGGIPIMAVTEGTSLLLPGLIFT
jgi:hypothetical protein